ncbi:MAG: DNA repair protein RadC [Nitrospiraceae bacterium]|nr:DNA repair protein RadC [Nitrospiraceae bacterium]
MKKIKTIPQFDRPREKMEQKGAKALSDLELLAVLLGSGIKGKDVFEVAKDILRLAQDDFDNISLEKLKYIEGVGLAKACQIMAAIEFSKRFLIKDGIKIKNVDDVIRLTDELKDKRQEYFLSLTLDGASNLIQKRTVFIGTLNHSIVHPREIFADAISDRAAGIIFVHNHPSGNVEPSKEDTTITQRLMEVGKIVGIEVIDHIIISKNGYFSFQAEGMDRRGIKGDRLVEKNRQSILKTFGTLLRKRGKTVVNVRKVTRPQPVFTVNMDKEPMAVGNLRHNATVFYTDSFEDELLEEVKDILEEIKSDESLPKSAEKEINQYLFKTPLSIVFTRAEPERRFVEHLCKKENAEKIDSWIKSRDQGFYSIEYSWRKGEHPQKNQQFNPDFFIKIHNDGIDYIVVVEVKSDGDDSDENRAKLKWATKQHFPDLNRELEDSGIKQKYIFHFLSPCSYTEFFQYLRDGRLIKGVFGSDLENRLEKNDREEL